MNSLNTVSLICHVCLTRKITTYEGTLHAVSILYRVVAVIPCRPVLSGIERIVKIGARWNGTLGDAINTVHMHSPELPNPMPVDACTVVGQVIDDVNVDPLKFVSL